MQPRFFCIFSVTKSDQIRTCARLAGSFRGKKYGGWSYRLSMYLSATQAAWNVYDMSIWLSGRSSKKNIIAYMEAVSGFSVCLRVWHSVGDNKSHMTHFKDFNRALDHMQRFPNFVAVAVWYRWHQNRVVSSRWSLDTWPCNWSIRPMVYVLSEARASRVVFLSSHKITICFQHIFVWI